MNADKPFKLPAEVIQRLSRRSDARGLTQLAAHLGMLLLAGAGLQQAFGSPWVLLAMPAYATLLIFLFAPLHETIHYTAFGSRWLNQAVAATIGFVLLLPAGYFRRFHYAHHRHTQDPGLDPELLDRKPLRGPGYWWHLSGLPTWWQSLQTIWRHARGRVDETWIDARHRDAIIVEARVHVAGYALLVLGSLLLSSGLLWWYWVLPALLGQPLLRLYLLAEHNGCDLSADMLENSRTTYTTPVVNFLAWNMPYHAEHHYLASIPFHALPALHAFTGQRVKHRGDGYLRVNREIYARVRASM